MTTARPPLVPLLVLLPLVCLPACTPQKTAPPERHSTSEQQAAKPPAAVPADISHGEAPIGTAADSAPVEARAPEPSRARVYPIRLEIRHAPVTVDEGVSYDAWTFGGRVPGPVYRVRQGDTVDFTLVNRAPMPHSMDFHAAEIAPDKYYGNLMPNDSVHYRFVPRVPGVFMYHCGTAPVAAHIANGMYGALIVDPVTPRPKAREFVLVQSEFYLGAKDSSSRPRTLDWTKVLDQAPDYVVFNGRVVQYAKHPITVAPNELLRLYLVNAGPNRVSSFHVVGGIFEKVFLDGSTTSPLTGVQTALVPVGGSGIFELRLREPGTYPFVTHAFADATKGAVGMLEAKQP